MAAVMCTGHQLPELADRRNSLSRRRQVGGRVAGSDYQGATTPMTDVMLSRWNEK
jgi:hypothetical protein